MNALVLFLGAALVADPEPVTRNTYFTAETLLAADSLFDPPLRAQSPGQGPYDENPPWSSPQTFAPPESPPLYDPLLQQPPGAGPADIYDPSLSFGAVGPQPYRFGWSSRYDVGFLPEEPVHGSGASGSFGIMELNAAWRYSTGWPTALPSVIFSWTPEFNYRSWSGPITPALPENVFRFASDFELATPGNNPVSLQLGFTPAFVSDLSASPNSDAFNWDGRGVVFLRTTPQFMVALGAAYLKRVDDIVIPYAGVVWTPNDAWELRLMFPKTRVSYFLGDLVGTAAWAYFGLEYNVEAYQINLLGPTGQDEKIQLRDYRATFGLRGEYRGLVGFVEVGWVFAREAEFLHGTPDFDIDTGFIGRLGLRF